MTGIVDEIGTVVGYSNVSGWAIGLRMDRIGAIDPPCLRRDTHNGQSSVRTVKRQCRYWMKAPRAST